MKRAPIANGKAPRARKGSEPAKVETADRCRRCGVEIAEQVFEAAYCCQFRYGPLTASDHNIAEEED